jgi:RNA polymerase sigma-70 factor, ECF subfamily
MSATSQAGAMTTEELFRQHAPFVARFLTRLGVPAEQAQDALQEVFLVVHRNGGYRPGVAKPTSYLAGIAIHAALKHRRRERVDRARHAEAGPEQMASEAADPTRALQTQQDLARLQLALDRLPDELRTTLVLVEIEGESCLSVAAALGWPVGTVYWRLHEARKKLQLALRSVDGALAQQRALASRPAAPERRRALRVSNLGIFMVFGADSSFQRSEAAQLLRLAREQPRVLGASEALLARHLELVRSGADLPGWAAGYVPHAASWLGLLGPGAAGSIAAITAAALSSALLFSAPTPQPSAARRDQPPSAAVRVAAAAPTAPSALAQLAPSPPNRAAALSVQRASPALVAVSTPPSAASRRANVADAASARTASGERVTGDTSNARVVRVSRPAPPEQNAAQPVSEQRSAESDAERRAARVPPLDAAASGSRTASQASDALEEPQQIASAERLLASAPARALTIVRAVETRFPDGYLREERAYVEVMALLGLGRAAEARPKAEAFLKAYPDGPYSRRVRGALAGAER